MDSTNASKTPDMATKPASQEDSMNDKSKPASEVNLVYNHSDQEPQIHFRTYIAVTAMLILNYVQVFALQGPPVVLDNIGKSLGNTTAQTWVPTALSLVQAVLAPIISSASDTFQARKLIIIICCIVSFIGSAIAPGSQSIYRLIIAQILIGCGFSSVALVYCVPSEILPKKWRPMVQSIINIAAALGACSGPLIIGALSRRDPINGWRNYYWIQMAMWGIAAVFIFIGYWPTKRYTVYDQMPLSQKIKALDLVGVGLFISGLVLFLVGLNLGGGSFSWISSKVLSPLIIGIITLLVFAVYEWKGTKVGIIHHDLFRKGTSSGRTFFIYLALIFIEAVMGFAFLIFYPLMTTALFEQDPFLLAARIQPFWLGAGISTLFWGYWSIKTKSFRLPLFTGFLIFTGGIIGFTTIQPDNSLSACVFAAVAGIGVGCPLILIIAGIQLTTPHALIATATALAATSRAVGATVFTVAFSAALTERLQPNIISYVSTAAAGLPLTSLEAFVKALAAQDMEALLHIPGVTPSIIAASVQALKQAFADSIRVVFIIAAPFGALACLLCWFLDDQSEEMNYIVDAPVENLRARSPA